MLTQQSLLLSLPVNFTDKRITKSPALHFFVFTTCRRWGWKSTFWVFEHLRKPGDAGMLGVWELGWDFGSVLGSGGPCHRILYVTPTGQTEQAAREERALYIV